MILKKIKKSFVILLTLLIIPINALAYSDYIIAGGENIGIELNSKGVIVVGLYKINNIYPADEAGIEVGDIITSIDQHKINNINDMVNQIKNSLNDTIKVEYIRSNSSAYTNLKLYKDNNIFKTGLYVKDSVSGIGTLTFIDPNTKKFGALGHEILESQTGKKIEVNMGKIYPSIVTGVNPSSNGNPGEKNARYDSTDVIGTIDENTVHGVFGTYNVLPDKRLYKVGSPDTIKKGNAKILTVLKDNTIEDFDINIIKISSNQSVKNLLFEITDQNLISKTGGIIQGMSGSPIIQDDKIIGAVTHVIVDNPIKGYGIFITNMLEEAEN